MARLASGVFRVVLAAALFHLAGCTSDDPIGCADDCGTGNHCEGNACVPDNTTNTASSGNAGSSSGLVYCEADAECRADEYCNTDVNACITRHDCDSAADCPMGQECRDFDGDTFRDCGFPGCQNDAECANIEPTCMTGTHAACVVRACVCQSPCGAGVCPVLCCGTTRQCIEDPGACSNVTCMPGFEGVPTARTWVVDLCDYTGPDCGCRELPPLPLGELGNPSAIGMDSTGRLFVAAYNRTYGDLMVGEYNATTDEVAWQFVDGVPLGAPVVGGPSGPRGGVEEPGPDVGGYLDMAVSPQGVLHIVYSDKVSLSLKYMRVDGTNLTRMTLDAQRETGVYPSIALDPSTGAPRVVYLTRRDESGGMPMAYLKMAAAHDATPGSAADFVFHTLAEEDLTRVNCEGGCRTGQACQERMEPLLDVCVDEAASCSPSCSATGGEFCSASGCRPMVAGSNTRRIPEGPGIWSATTVRTDGKPVTVVYNTFTSSLVAYTTQSGDPVDSPTARFDERVLAGAVDDAGSWPGIAVDPSGVVHVGYVHATTKALTHVQLAGNLSVTSTDVVDDASRDNGMFSDVHHLAEPAIVLRSDGVAVIAYQDSTTGELWMAVESGNGMYTRTVLAGGLTGTAYDGFYGFSTDMVAQGPGAPVISTFRYNVDLMQTSNLVFFHAP